MLNTSYSDALEMASNIYVMESVKLIGIYSNILRVNSKEERNNFHPQAMNLAVKFSAERQCLRIASEIESEDSASKIAQLLQDQQQLKQDLNLLVQKLNSLTTK
jgi:hypothetical protein